jgi:hypothetical protein
MSVSPGDERTAALDPEHEVVRLLPRERVDANRQSIAGREQLPPLDRIALLGLRYELRSVEPLHEAAGIALVPRAGQHDRRVAAGRELLDLARQGQRVEQQQTVTVLDCVGGDLLAVPLERAVSRPPLRVRCLPVPQAGLHFPHRAILRRSGRVGFGHLVDPMRADGNVAI